jgi:cephalosporin-C deacetylase-like acetyl esterase
MLFVGLLHKVKNIHFRFVVIAAVFLILILNKSYGQTSAIENKQPKRFAISYIKAAVFDNPILVKGLELKDLQDNRCIQLIKGAKSGLAEDYFFEESGKYNISVYYFNNSNGKPLVKVIINDSPIGTVAFDSDTSKSESSRLQRKVLPGIDIDKWSKIDLQFNGNANEKCCVAKVVFTRTGDYEGKVKELPEPKTLDVFENAQDLLYGRSMLSDFVNDRIDSLMNKRVEGFSSLKTPKEWAEQQNETREKLESFFGKFPKKAPLKAKITGKIEHEKYSVEKLYYESQPNYYVTANLYIPKNRKEPMPAVLFTSGHSGPGKMLPLYQEACIGLALKGYVVLAIDPMGQGERIEYFNSNDKKENVEGAVAQHYYLGRPSFLVNWSLSGLRVWDCIRALDYLTSRPEVDTSKIAAVGNSGGGQMALLITAVDKRIKVCAAGHPGGQMEKNYLLGQNLIDRQIFSLIAPRPVRVIVGEKSGEAEFHQKKIDDIQLFDEGLGYSKERAQLVLVDGVHDLKYPKREKVYDWLNKWFNKEEEGSTEPPIKTEKPQTLWATKSGLTLVSLGGETGQTLNAKRLKNIYKPEKDVDKLKKQVAERIGLNLNGKETQLKVHSFGSNNYGDVSVEKLTYQTEEGILIPSLLVEPKNVKSNSPVYIYASERGKPSSYNESLTPFALAKKGYIVLAIDVRGVGETSPTPNLPMPTKYSECTQFQWYHDCLAIQSPGFGRTMLGMRTLDVIRGIDLLQTRKELQGKKIIVYGKGIGGLWATLASIYDSRVIGVITDGTLTSYKQLVNNKYYAVSSDYFWGAPGVLCSFDIPDLVRLASVKQQTWLNPINGMGQKLSASQAANILGHSRNTQIVISKENATKAVLSLH